MSFIKIYYYLFIIALLASCVPNKEINVSATYPEPEDPIETDISAWDSISSGLNASFASVNTRFVRNTLPNVVQENTWNGVAWKAERIAAQIVLWSKDSSTNVAVEFSDFISKDGNKLPKTIAEARFVKYVITDEFAGGCGYRKPEDFAASLAADALDNVSSYAVKAYETRPLWLTINIPADAKIGNYTSTLTLNIEGEKSQVFTLNIEVLPKTLPAPTDWKFHLDLWQNPYAVARFNKVQPWSKEHWDLLKPIMKQLADAGQKAITVSLNKRPWGGQTFDQFEAMITWKKKTDGSWEYDYTVFDNWVQFMMDLGIKNQISCYSMVPWGNEFYYFDEQTNEEVKIKAAPGSKEYDDLWTPFLIQFKKHLEKKGWNNITRMAMDERTPKEMKAMLSLLNNIAPEFGIAFADNHKSYKLYPNELKDLSVAFGATIDEEDLNLRKENGYISTHYVCCSDGFPNVFTFSPPAEGVFIGWYSIAANFDGFLRWAYNSWVENPLQDSRFRAWPAGDTYIVYPKNRSSIRFETLREGIQDAEKIRILREDFTKRNMTKELNLLNTTVAKFNITTKPDNLEVLLRNAKYTLNSLAKK